MLATEEIFNIGLSTSIDGLYWFRVGVKIAQAQLAKDLEWEAKNAKLVAQEIIAEIEKHFAIRGYRDEEEFKWLKALKVRLEGK